MGVRKGRRNVGETNRECAIREFQEETNYTTNDYELIDNIAPLDEEYMGENIYDTNMYII